jgi:hypothetical protein
MKVMKRIARMMRILESTESMKRRRERSDGGMRVRTVTLLENNDT